MINWAYGLTTIPNRERDLLPRTLKSLAAGGFPNPHLFIDNCQRPFHDHDYERFGCTVTPRGPTLGIFGNLVLGLWELYIRNPECHRYAMFQDDFVTCLGLREYLDRCKYPKQGYWNLYTFPQNQELAPEDFTGWYESNQLGRGAVALVFSREALQVLLRGPHMASRPCTAVIKRRTKSVDGAIGKTFADAGWKEYVHTPSLVQHTGAISTLSNGCHDLAVSFPGENFNLSELKERPCETVTAP